MNKNIPVTAYLGALLITILSGSTFLEFINYKDSSNQASVTQAQIVAKSNKETAKKIPQLLSETNQSVRFDTEEIKRGKKAEDKVQSVRVDTKLLKGSTELSLNLTDEISVTAVRDRYEEINGGIAWVGHVLGNEEDRIYLSVHGGVTTGIINYEDRIFEIVYTKGENHVLREIETDFVADSFEHDAIEVPAEDSSQELFPLTKASMTYSSSSNAEDVVIDVLVMYTPEAQKAAGGKNAIESRIISAVAETNDAYARSDIPVQINLVHTKVGASKENPDIVESLEDFRDLGDKYYDGIHSLRNQYFADQVVLIQNENTNTSVLCGTGYQMREPSINFQTSAFSAVTLGCLNGYWVFAHELGHNQGMHHDKEHANGDKGSFSYSYGYTDCETFGTIMSYSHYCETPRIGYFSNPDIKYNGKPIGTAEANNAETLRRTARIVADFRNPEITEPPLGPKNLEVEVYEGRQEVGLTWEDLANTESGYIVARSTNQTDWEAVGKLADNTTSFVDTVHIPNQTFYYLVFGYNGFGFSPPSNLAEITSPPDATVDLERPNINIVSPSNGLKIGPDKTLEIVTSASDDVSIKMIRIEIDGKSVAICDRIETCTAHVDTNTLSSGTHTITAITWDTSNKSNRALITITKTSPPVIPVNPYDVNKDGNVNMDDLLLVNNALTPGSPTLDSTDVNGDGVTDAQDLFELRNYFQLNYDFVSSYDMYNIGAGWVAIPPNGKIDQGDINALNFLISVYSLDAKNYSAFGDLNQDGQLTVADRAILEEFISYQ